MFIASFTNGKETGGETKFLQRKLKSAPRDTERRLMGVTLRDIRSERRELGSKLVQKTA